MPLHDFLSYVQKTYPELLSFPSVVASQQLKQLAHGTTIIGLCYTDGVLLAGDRKISAGNKTEKNLADKIVPIDTYAAIAFSGALAVCLHMARVIRITQTNFRKKKARHLSLEGKANILGQLIRQNLPQALEGLAFIPLLAGYDPLTNRGFVYSYDFVGGVYQNTDYATEGSGREPAALLLEDHWKADLSQEEALQLTLRALHKSAQHDSATGGIQKKALPRIYIINHRGGTFVPDQDLQGKVEQFYG